MLLQKERNRIYKVRNGQRKPWNDVSLLNDVVGMDSYYINKPQKLIITTLFRFYGWFFICTLLSFHLLIIPMVPVWAYCMYRFYIGLKCMEKYNVSKCKVVLYSCFVIVVESIISIYIRKAIWFVVTQIL